MVSSGRGRKRGEESGGGWGGKEERARVGRRPSGGFIKWGARAQVAWWCGGDGTGARVTATSIAPYWNKLAKR